MKILVMSLFLVSFSACAASNGGGGFVVGNPMMPASEGKEAAKAVKKNSDLAEKEPCECKDAKPTPPCECRVEAKQPADAKPAAKPERKKK